MIKAPAKIVSRFGKSGILSMRDSELEYNKFIKE